MITNVHPWCCRFLAVCSSRSFGAWTPPTLAGATCGRSPSLAPFQVGPSSTISKLVRAPRFVRSAAQPWLHDSPIILVAWSAQPGPPNPKTNLASSGRFSRRVSGPAARLATLDEINAAAEAVVACSSWSETMARRAHSAIAAVRTIEAASHCWRCHPTAFEIVTWARAKVARDCHVRVQSGFYSIPWSARPSTSGSATSSFVSTSARAGRNASARRKPWPAAGS